MCYLRILLILFLTNTIIFSQNLVLNPSFEENTLKQHYCPTLINLQGVKNWRQVTKGSVDYHKNGRICEGRTSLNNHARTGDYYLGIYVISKNPNKRYREYIQGEFKFPLEKDKEYLIEYYIKLGHESNTGTSDFGIYIGMETPEKKKLSRLKYLPQIKSEYPIMDKNNWIKVSGKYKAFGGETHIILGNFQKRSDLKKESIVNNYNYEKSYYYLDDVSVIEVTPEFKSITREETVKVDTITISKLPNIGDKIIMSSLRFRTNQHNLIDSTHKELDKIVTLLTVNPFLKVEISGHTDSIGNPKTNISLSERRAETVKYYLLEKGISINRISTSGKGSSEPISTNSTEEGRAMNRRIEITIMDVFEYKE